jgi:hypothetical protein
LIFATAFIVDLVYLNHLGLLTPYLPVFIACRAICGTITVLLIVYEGLQMKFSRRENLVQYMLEYYNINDCLLIVTYSTYLILSFVPINRNYEYECAIKSLQCLIVVFLFLKVYTLLRLFSNISFLVQMLISVFSDLFYFMMIFAVIIGGFTVLLEVILQSKANADEGLVSKNTLLK